MFCLLPLDAASNSSLPALPTPPTVEQALSEDVS